MSEGVSTSVSLDDKAANADLAALAKRIKDLDPVLDEIGASQVTEVQHRFEQQAGPDGAKWTGLAARTLARRGGDNPKILRDQGNLYDSVTHKVDSGVAVAIGTNRRYARIHQLGGKAGPGRRVTIPARPYLGLSDEGRKEVVAILEDHLEGK